MSERFEELLYKSGLTAQGCWDEMDEYAQQAIERFAELVRVDERIYGRHSKCKWVGLTDAQISLMISTHKSLTDLCRVIEAKLKEKNCNVG